MPDAIQLDRTYHYILETLVARGQAPHYTEIAKEFAVTPREGKGMLHDLMALGLPNWLHPNTDLIASFAPFNNLPTHYRVTVDGEQKWFAQCGLEAVAISWLFPGKTIEVEAPCLSSGDPLHPWENSCPELRLTPQSSGQIALYLRHSLKRGYRPRPTAAPQAISRSDFVH